MREHVFGEIDDNKDGLVSLDEFIKSTQSENFDEDEPWRVIQPCIAYEFILYVIRLAAQSGVAVVCTCGKTTTNYVVVCLLQGLSEEDEYDSEEYDKYEKALEEQEERLRQQQEHKDQVCCPSGNFFNTVCGC